MTIQHQTDFDSYLNFNNNERNKHHHHRRRRRHYENNLISTYNNQNNNQNDDDDNNNNNVKKISIDDNNNTNNFSQQQFPTLVTTSSSTKTLKKKSKIPIYQPNSKPPPLIITDHKNSNTSTEIIESMENFASASTLEVKDEQLIATASTRLLARKAAEKVRNKHHYNQQHQSIPRSKSVNNQHSESSNMKPLNLTQTLNLSTLSILSASLSQSTLDSASGEANQQTVYRRSNFEELIKWLRKCLRKIEKEYSADSLYDYLRAHFKSSANNSFGSTANLTMNSIESHQQQQNSSSSIRSTSNRSSSVLRSTPVERNGIEQPPIGFIYDVNGKNLVDFPRQSVNPIKLLFKNLRAFRKLYSILQADLLANLISLELNSLPCDLEPSRRLPRLGDSKDEEERLNKLTKHHAKLFEINEKLNLLIHEQSSCDIKLLSSHSALPSEKYKNTKHIEYILRLTPDVIYKMRTMIKLCEKCYDECNNISSQQSQQQQQQQQQPKNIKDKRLELKKSLSTQCPIPSLSTKDTKRNHHHRHLMSKQRSIEVDFEIPRPPTPENPLPQMPTWRTWSIKPDKKEKIEDDENYFEDIKDEGVNTNKNADSFIQETDCSSIISDEEDTHHQKLPQRHSPTNHQLSTSSSQRRQKALQEELKNVKRKIDSAKKSIEELQSYLRNLLERSDRCDKLKTQLRSDKELIRKTERSLRDTTAKFGDNPLSSSSSISGELFRAQLNKQLDYLKYRFKLNMQDLSIEKMCAPEINTAIIDTERKLAEAEKQLDDSNRYLEFIQSKLASGGEEKEKVTIAAESKPKIVINSKTALIKRRDKPLELPPLTKPFNVFNVD